MRARRLMLPVLLLVALLLGSQLVARPALAQLSEVHVAPGGRNIVSCGTAASPCQTIPYGLGRAATGGTIQVAAGVYTAEVTITRAVTIRGPNAGLAGNSPARGPEATMERRWRINGGGLTIDGLRFAGAIPAGGAGVLQASEVSSGIADIVIRNSVFENLDRSALHTSLPAANRATNARWTIEDNLVRALNGTGRVGFSLQNLSDVTVRRNVIQRPTASAVLLEGVVNALIEHNRIEETPQQAINLAGALAEVVVRENSISRANSSNGVDRAAIRLNPDSFAGPVRIQHNIVQDSAGAVAVLPANGGHSQMLVRGNLFAGDSGGVRRGGAAGTVDMRCNFWGERSGFAAGENPGGTGAPLASPDGGTTLAAPWLVAADDADPDLPGLQRPAETPLLIRPVDEISAAVNDFRTLANAVGCAEAGQTLVLEGLFDWSGPVAQAAWKLGSDLRPGTDDDHALTLPDPGGAMALRAEQPGGAMIRGITGEPAARGLLLTGSRTDWTLSGLELDEFHTAVAFSPSAAGTLTMRQLALTASVAVGLDAQAPGATVRTECVFWGDASGPTHPTNPGGRGALILGEPTIFPFARSPFACTPLPVTLTAFSATRTAAGVLLRWTSASELGVSGYRLFRAVGPDREQAEPVGPPLIPAEGGLVEASYSHLDQGAPALAHYWLETVEAVPTRYGPLVSQMLHLPLVRR